MRGTEVDLLRRSYEALNEGNVEVPLAALHADAVWRESAELPGADVVRSRSEIEAFLKEFLESWSSFHQEIEGIEVKGDQVAVLLHMRGVGRGSGAEIDTRYGHVWTMRGGHGVSVDAYRDQLAALRALEAEPKTP
jgi:ketosteroid isomerase-like protein